MTRRIGVFLKGFPRVSETFIAQELALLEQSGLQLQLISLRHPTDTKRHKVHDEIKAPILYLPEYIHHEIPRCLKAWWRARRYPNYGKLKKIFLKDLFRDFTRNRLRRLFQSFVVASELNSEYDWLFYAHFIHTPASVARYASILFEVPFCISAHAKDIWTSPRWELEEKIKEAQWIVTCTKNGARHLRSLAHNKDSVHLLYHGLDLSRFPSPARTMDGITGDGSDADSPVYFLSVGRMVEKKGFDTLLLALSRLDSKLHWRWIHIGSGPLKGRFISLSEDLGIGSHIDFRGTQTQDEVLRAYRSADIFILPCRIAPDGDRDGLPNVIVEAQSQALPVISSPISGIPELIDNNINGILVAPDSPDELSDAILSLSRDPKKRLKMGLAGEARVHKEFDSTREIQQLLGLFSSESR